MLDKKRLIRVSGGAIDLSKVNITGGRLSARETANCYVISEPGEYCFPLVYGCAITAGTTNAASYTKQGAYTQPFYNHLNTEITSPFLENVATPVSAQVIQYDTTGYAISELTIKNCNPCKFLKFTVNSVPALGGNAIIAVKDGSGNIMWSWHIWAYPFSLGTFTHTNTNNVSYNILDVNIGWVKKATNSKYGTSPYYQWGRKDPFLRSGATSGTIVTADTATSVAQTIKAPTTFNKYETSNYNWLNVTYFYNYWDADCTNTGSSDKVVNKTIYDPSPVGFSIPCGNTFLGFSTSNGGTYDSGYTWDNNYFAAAGYRNGENGVIGDVGATGLYWRSSSYWQRAAHNLFLASRGVVYPDNSGARGTGVSVRPVRRT